MEVDFCIFGGGPSGITTALLLKERFPTNKVLICERETKIGGCWRTEWKLDGLYTEHSPRVISGDNFNWLLKKLDIDPEGSMKLMYGSVAKTVSNFGWNIVKEATLYDALVFITHYILFAIGLNTDTHQGLKELSVQDWLDKNNFSNPFKTIINKFCILIADAPYKMSLLDFFLSFALVSFRRLNDTEEWLKRVEKDTTIQYSTSLIKFTSPTSALVETPGGSEILKFKECFICVSPHVLPKIINTSVDSVKENWGVLDSDSYYMSVGFQLHYKESFELNCTSLTCETPWNIVVVKNEYTKNKDIHTVLSCALIDQDSISNMPDNLDDLGAELVDQVSKLVEYTPMYLTFFSGLQFNKNTRQWESRDSGHLRTPKTQLVPSKGKLSNMYILGSQNKHGVSSLDKVIGNVRDFFKDNYQLT